MIKLNTRENRAQKYCEVLKEYIAINGYIVFSMTWVKNPTWGLNPVITDHHGDRCVSVSGCGYDKESSALSQLLKFLYPVESEQYESIQRLDGAGAERIQKKLKEFGYELETQFTCATVHSYLLKAVKL